METKNKWYTKKCGRCGNPHIGYTSKIDQYGIEYVICEFTNKRMNIFEGGKFFYTKWIRQEDNK